jgi:hypothetical protein
MAQDERFGANLLLLPHEQQLLDEWMASGTEDGSAAGKL